MCAAFGIKNVELTPLDRGVWRAGDVVLKPAGDYAAAAWVAQTLDTLEVDGVRLPRPVRGTDGRWVVAGWVAMRRLSGRHEPRHDEVVDISLRLHRATAGLTRPRFLGNRTDVWALADRVAWGEASQEVAAEHGGLLFDDLVARRRPVRMREQIVHGDLFGNVLFAADAPPAVIDFSVYWRPPEWAAAVVVIDALAWGDADENLAYRWAELSQWPQMLLRALLFRLVAHALHPGSTPESLAGLRRAAVLARELI